MTNTMTIKTDDEDGTHFDVYLHQNPIACAS